MRALCRQIVVAMVSCLLIGPAAWGQTPGESQIGTMNRLHDTAKLRTESFASLKLTFKDGTLSSSLEKYMPNVIFVRAELDGEPLKLARGPKPKEVEGLSPGDLVVEVERPLNTTRQRTECTGYLFEGEQEVLIHPGGTEGVACQFVSDQPRPAAAPKVTELPGEDLSDWELGLTAEQFEIVGACLNDHEQGSAGYWKCVEEGGVPLPED